MATWVKVEVDVMTHFKTRNLRRMLKCSTMREAAGYPIALWCFAIEHAWRDGDLTAYGDDGVEDACEWRGKPGELVKALQNCGKAGSGHGFLRRDSLVVHEFGERTGRLVKDRLYHEERRKGATAPHKLSGIEAEITAAWNIFAPRHGLLRANTARCAFDLKIETFGKALEAASLQPFLLGAGEGGWKMDLPWLLKHKNFNKVLLGGYGSSGAERSRGGPTSDEIDKKSREVLKARGML